MPGDRDWGKGLGIPMAELKLLEQWGLNASPQDLYDCADELWNGTDNLMETLAVHLHQTTRGQLGDVANNWYGIGDPCRPMWLNDCTVTPKQIHQVMIETSARVCTLLAIGRGGVNRDQVTPDYWLQCGHPKFRTIIAWPEAQVEDAHQDTLAQIPWQPANPDVSGVIRLWIFTPFNDGYNDQATPDQVDQAKGALATLNARRGTGQLQRLSRNDVFSVLDNLPRGSFPWRGTNLAVPCDPAAYEPTRPGLSLRFIPAVLEPPLSLLSQNQPRLDKTRPPVPGIEISWYGATDGAIPNPVSDSV
jgi:hypothetical protein